jgi:tol-pal system protein YbgF
MRKTYVLATLAAALVAAAPAFAQRASLADRVAALEQQAANNQGNVDLLNQVQQLRSEVQALRSQLEDLQQQNEQLKQSARSQYLDLDGRLNRLEGGASTAPAPATSTAAPPRATPTTTGPDRAPTVRGDAGRLAAGRGRTHRLQRRLRRAEGRRLRAVGATQFQAFLRDYPAGTYAPNALYWLGESYYVTQNYELALAQFQALLDRYPTHDKAPGALLKVGLAQYGLKRMDAAEATLAQVSQRYPGSDAARTAEDRLRAIQLGASAEFAGRRAGRVKCAPCPLSSPPGGPRIGGSPQAHRNLPVPAGRSPRCRLAHRVRAPHRLPAALPVLRHRVRLPRRRVVGHRRDPGRSRQPRRAPRLRHRRRTARAEARHRPAVETLRCRLRRLARNLRRDRHRRRRHARVAHRRHQDAGFGRSRAQPLGKPRAAHAARPGEVRDLQPRRFRVGVRRAARTRAGRALRRAVLAEPRAGVAARRSPTGSSRTRLPVRFQMQLHKALWGDEPGR